MYLFSQKKKKELVSVEEKNAALLKKSSLNIQLLPEMPEDKKLAGLLKLIPLKCIFELLFYF